MIQLIITAIICLANSSLLIYSFANLGPIFVGYFFITQAIISWFLIDSIISYQSDKSQIRRPIENIHFHKDPGLNPVVIPAQARSLQGEAGPVVEEIDYELNSMEFSINDFNQSGSSHLIFIEKSISDPFASQLTMVDDVIQKFDANKKSLLISNLPRKNDLSPSLFDFLNGYKKMDEILCSNIYGCVDLIPNLGDLDEIPAKKLVNYVNRQLTEYDQVVFYLKKVDLTFIEHIFGRDQDSSEGTFVPASLM